MTAIWNREAIEALGPTTDVPTAASILGLDGPWSIYEAIRRGEWGLTRTLRLGRKIKIPTHDLIVLLYAPDMNVGAPATGAPAATSVQEDIADGSHRTPGARTLRAIKPTG